jgi:uncharacterized protein (UPF0332 family)
MRGKIQKKNRVSCILRIFTACFVRMAEVGTLISAFSKYRVASFSHSRSSDGEATLDNKEAPKSWHARSRLVLKSASHNTRYDHSIFVRS